MSYASLLLPCLRVKPITLAVGSIKRLSQNRDRAIILAKGGRHWFYTYLYGKQDTANISEAELVGFRELAKYYTVLTTEQIRVLMRRKELVEICHDCKK